MRGAKLPARELKWPVLWRGIYAFTDNKTYIYAYCTPTGHGLSNKLQPAMHQRTVPR